MAMLREELVICTVDGDLLRLNWDGAVNQDGSTHINEILFSLNLQQSKGMTQACSTHT